MQRNRNVVMSRAIAVQNLGRFECRVNKRDLSECRGGSCVPKKSSFFVRAASGKELASQPGLNCFWGTCSVTIPLFWHGPQEIRSRIFIPDIISLYDEVMNGNENQQPSALEGICEVDQVDSCKVSDARAALPSETELRQAADAFRALANPNRLRVLKALHGRELCVCDLREVLGISMSGTSQALRELRSLGAVDFRTEGKLAYYRLADEAWFRVAEGVLGRFAVANVTSGPHAHEDES